MNLAAPKISLIICTHNPRTEALSETLRALSEQTLDKSQWELLLVDNHSKIPVRDWVDLSWHPIGIHIREEKLGLSNARLCGIHHSRGRLLIFVDDDNVLDPSYLATAWGILTSRAYMGVWGCHIEARFAQTPPSWLPRWAHHLAVRECREPVWASYVSDRNVPYGAGMCVRREVAEGYQTKAQTDALCVQLDRVGTALGSAGDHDICHTAQDMGYGIGRFPELRMTHLIPETRMKPEYFVRLAYGNSRSALTLALARNAAPSYRRSLAWPMLKYIESLIRSRGTNGKIFRAQARGEMDAIRAARRAKIMLSA